MHYLLEVFDSNAFCCTENISYSIDYTDSVRVENISLNVGRKMGGQTDEGDCITSVANEVRD